MIRRLFFCLTLAMVVLVAPPMVLAESTRTKLQKVQDAIEQRKAAQEALEQKAREQSAGLIELRQKLIAASQAVSEKQDEKKTLEDRQQQLADDIEVKEKALMQERDKLAALIRALIALGRQPPQSLLFQDGLTQDHIHRTLYVRALVPRVKEQAESLAHDLADLAALKAKLNEQQKLTQAASRNLDDQRRNLDQLVKTRQGLLQRTEAQKAQMQKQLDELAAQAQDLRELLEKIAPKKTRKPATSANSPVMMWPVKGGIVRGFNDRDADGVKSQGIAFAALSGAPVVAPAAGRVAYAGSFKTYGLIVILQHPGGYHSFIAGFGRLDAELGQEVDAGEPIGVMPVKSGVKPELYFEWRRNGEPVEPALRK